LVREAIFCSSASSSAIPSVSAIFLPNDPTHLHATYSTSSVSHFKL
jgi:hypothetical protein